MSEEEDPIGVNELIAQMNAEARAKQKKVERFHTESEAILQRIRHGVYAIVDQPQGPSDSSALIALKSWTKACNLAAHQFKKVHPDLAELWLTELAAMLRMTHGQRTRNRSEDEAKEGKNP